MSEREKCELNVGEREKCEALSLSCRLAYRPAGTLSGRRQMSHAEGGIAWTADVLTV